MDDNVVIFAPVSTTLSTHVRFEEKSSWKKQGKYEVEIKMIQPFNLSQSSDF